MRTPAATFEDLGYGDVSEYSYSKRSARYGKLIRDPFWILAPDS